MIHILVVLFLFLAVFLIGILNRDQQVYKLVDQMIEEESIWIKSHLDLWVSGKYNDMFIRHKTKVHQTRWVLEFWIPLSHYRYQAGSVAQYYLKNEEN